jgi:phospholipid transport system substrate-binding protein
LGPAARSASSSELSAFIPAFRGYVARKYGKRFKEFIGSEIVVKGTKNRGKFFEVEASVRLKGTTPFEVSFRVSDRSGENLFFDIIIEGISLLASERVEIGALLDARNGNIARLTRDLVNLG